MFVPGYIDEKLEIVFGREVKQPTGRDVVYPHHVGLKLSDLCKILRCLLRRSKP
jgi:hypothetical protein